MGIDPTLLVRLICSSYVVTYSIKITGGDQILGNTNLLQKENLAKRISSMRKYDCVFVQ
jgi:hypothetical protein